MAKPQPLANMWWPEINRICLSCASCPINLFFFNQ